MKKFSPFLSFSIREYRVFLTGFFIAQMGVQMQLVAINWQLYEMTRSAVVLGMVGIVSFVPVMFLSMFGGLAADNGNRKKLLIITQLLVSLLALALAAATMLHVASPLIIFAVLAMHFGVMAFFGPVRQSIIPDLVPRSHLLNAVSLNTLTRQSAVVIGPAIAGFLIALYGVQSIYLITAASLILTVITILPLKIPLRADGPQKATFSWHSVMEGIHFVRKSRIMLSAILLDFFATFFGSATSLLPIFALDILHVDAKGLGMLYAATSIGAVLSGLVLSTFKKLSRQGWIIIVSVAVYGLAAIGFGLSRSFYLSLLLLGIGGAGDMVSTILRNTLRQSITPAHIRGRMVGINILFAQGGPKLGDAEAGFVAAAASAPVSVVIGGIGTIVATICIALLMPGLRKYKGEDMMI